MAFDRENIIRKQELRLINQQLQAQVAALQNSTQTEGNPGRNKSPDLHALDKQIQKQIVEAKLSHHLIPTTHIDDSPLSKDI